MLTGPFIEGWPRNDTLANGTPYIAANHLSADFSSPDYFMLILGLNAFHADSAAVLIRDGALAGAIAEERLGERQKHFAGFPSQAVQAVLKDAGIGPEDLDFIAIGHDPRANVLAKMAYSARNPARAIRSARNLLSRQQKIASIPEPTGRCRVWFARSDGFVSGGQC